MALSAEFRLDLRRGDREAARATAVRLAECRSGETGALVGAGRLLLDSAEPAKAARCLSTALEQMDDLDPKVLVLLGRARLEEGNIPEAERALLAANALDVANPHIPFLLGLAAARKGDRLAAQSRFEEALVRQPGYAPARDALQRLAKGAAKP